MGSQHLPLTDFFPASCISFSGHMVPTFQPAASLAFFERFLAGKPY
jgi:hypothetical protein